MNEYEKTRCTVCQRSDAGHNPFGNRHFCDEHFAAFAQDSPFLWRTFIISLIAAIVPAVILAIASQFVTDQQQTVSPWLAVILVVIPSSAWIARVYRRLQSSDLSFPIILPAVFIAGALVAAALSRPVLYDLIKIDVWLSNTTASNRFLADILIQGFFHSFALYAIVRYSVWRTPIFTRRSDGILFTLSAAWGYAPMLVVLITFSLGQLALRSGSLFVATRLLAYLVPAPVIGFFLGRNRFEDMPFYYLSAGVAIGAFLCGLTLYAGTELNNIAFNLAQVGYSPWPGLVFSIVAILGSFLAIAGLTTRQNSLTRARLHIEI